MKFLLTLTMLFGSLAFAQSTPNTNSAVTATVSYTQAVGAINVSRANKVAFGITISATAPAAVTFTCAASNICTKVDHGFVTGTIVRLTTSAADLPDPLLTGTDYYVIYLSSSTFSLATSLVDAQAGTAVDITDAGTGTHTMTATAVSGASVKLQGSMDGTNYFDLPIKATGDATKSVNITTTGTLYLSEGDLSVNYARLYFTLTAGQLSVSEVAKVKIDRP